MIKDILTETLLWFQKAVPCPNSKNLHSQIGVHLEEVNEMLMEIVSEDFETVILIDTAKAALHALSTHLKASDNVIRIPAERREKYLDALCDQIVTAVGCGHMSDLSILFAMREVNRSNFSKFDHSGQPIFDPNMKIMKSANYEKAHLSPYI